MKNYGLTKAAASLDGSAVSAESGLPTPGLLDELSLVVASPGFLPVLLFVVLTFPLHGLVPTFERPLPGEWVDRTPSAPSSGVFVKEAAADLPWEGKETITITYLFLICLGVPLVLFVATFLVIRVRGDLRAAAYGLTCALTTTNLAVDLLKNYTGVLRPFFYERCGWDETAVQCVEAAASIHPSEVLRQSFPSGHAAGSACALGFASLYLLGKVQPGAAAGGMAVGRARSQATAAHWTTFTCPWWCSGAAAGQEVSAAPALAFVATLPAWASVWVMATRVRENFHHPSDVIAGALLGFGNATFWYRLAYPSPWAREGSHVPLVSAARGAAAAGAKGDGSDEERLPLNGAVSNHKAAPMNQHAPRV